MPTIATQTPRKLIIKKTVLNKPKKLETKKKRCVVYYLHSGEVEPNPVPRLSGIVNGSTFVRDFSGYTVAEVGTHKEGKRWYLLKEIDLLDNGNFSNQSIWEITSEHWAKNAKKFTMPPPVKFKSNFVPNVFCDPRGFEHWPERRDDRPIDILKFEDWLMSNLGIDTLKVANKKLEKVFDSKKGREMLSKMGELFDRL